MDTKEEVQKIVDQIQILAEYSSEHPDPVARLYAAGRLIDTEIFKRMGELRAVEFSEGKGVEI